MDQKLFFDLVGEHLESPVMLGIFFTSLSVVPVMVLATSAFIKINVVLNILRNALSGGQVPSVIITGLLSVVLSIHVMEPVAHKMYKGFLTGYETQVSGPKKVKKLEVDQVVALAASTVEPLRQFMRRHSYVRERAFFANQGEVSEIHGDSTKCPTGSSPGDCDFSGETFFSLLSAFVVSELNEAFTIGFCVYLPFLVIDLVVANLLVGMGMMMVSPVTIAMPFKLILFVMADGWYLLARGLVLGYQ